MVRTSGQATLHMKGQRMDSAERWRRMRLAQETWKHKNRAAYLAQKRVASHRPEYLARRRVIDAQRREALLAERKRAQTTLL